MLLKKVMLSLVLMLGLSSCGGYGSTHWLATTTDYEASQYLQVLPNRKICSLVTRSTFSTEIQAIDRAMKEYRRRNLAPNKCEEVYLRCLDLNIPDSSPDFNKCLIETANTLVLERQMKEMRRDFQRAEREQDRLRDELRDYRRDKNDLYRENNELRDKLRKQGDRGDDRH